MHGITGRFGSPASASEQFPLIPELQGTPTAQVAY